MIHCDFFVLSRKIGLCLSVACLWLLPSCEKNDDLPPYRTTDGLINNRPTTMRTYWYRSQSCGNEVIILDGLDASGLEDLYVQIDIGSFMAGNYTLLPFATVSDNSAFGGCANTDEAAVRVYDVSQGDVSGAEYEPIAAGFGSGNSLAISGFDADRAIVSARLSLYLEIDTSDSRSVYSNWGDTLRIIDLHFEAEEWVR